MLCSHVRAWPRTLLIWTWTPTRGLALQFDLRPAMSLWQSKLIAESGYHHWTRAAHLAWVLWDCTLVHKATASGSFVTVLCSRLPLPCREGSLCFSPTGANERTSSMRNHLQLAAEPPHKCQSRFHCHDFKTGRLLLLWTPPCRNRCEGFPVWFTLSQRCLGERRGYNLSKETHIFLRFLKSCPNFY